MSSFSLNVSSRLSQRDSYQVSRGKSLRLEKIVSGGIPISFQNDFREEKKVCPVCGPQTQW